jgi:hypothetical protein
MKNPEQKTSPFKPLDHFFLIASIALTLFTLAFSWWSYKQEKEEHIKNIININELYEKAVNTYLTQLSNDLIGLGQDIGSAAGFSSLNQTFLRVKRFKELHPELRNVTLMQEDGQVLLTARNAPGPDLPSLAGEPSFQPFRTEFQPVEMLQNFWKAAPFTKTTALGLMRDDGFLISRYPVPARLDFVEIYGKPRTGVLINFLKQAARAVEPTKKKRILVMDDDEMVRRMTGAILGRLGYEAVLVEKEEKAVERYRAEKESGRTLVFEGPEEEGHGVG